MRIYGTVGAVSGWLLVSLFYGQLMPVLSAPTIIAVLVGMALGTIVGAILSGGDSSE